MVRNIVFDMGMVLMDFHPLEACRAVAPDEQGAQEIYAALFGHPEWIKLDDGTITEEDLAQHAMARLSNESLRPLVPALFAGMPYNVLTPIPGMAELVDWVFDCGFGVYLLSNAGLMVSQHREIIPRIERFHGVVFSVEEGIIKPSPEIYRHLTDRYHLNPKECLFIDDNPTNAEAARQIGWYGYAHNGDIPALKRLLEACARELAD